jgi:hypothetical protein
MIMTIVLEGSLSLVFCLAFFAAAARPIPSPSGAEDNAALAAA